VCVAVCVAVYVAEGVAVCVAGCFAVGVAECVVVCFAVCVAVCVAVGVAMCNTAGGDAAGGDAARLRYTPDAVALRCEGAGTYLVFTARMLSADGLGTGHLFDANV